ncbi:terminase small subunit [Larkinella terrae]|uniref:Terminase small subunit n=1 Tax=Larkinella terrae TaxID=2025311 RepID=A0A7K0EJ33_9BACT|nr:terminase small subunit [Larkinella terrae]MRS61765.1 hypothetical protein [Larkinella terrae]
MAKLAAKQKRFVEAYCIHLNAARAAREAGYATAYSNREGHRLLTNVDISAAVKFILDTQGMSSEEGVRRLTDWGRASLEPFVAFVPSFSLKRHLDDDDEEEEEFDDESDQQPEEEPRMVAIIDLASDAAKENLHLLKKIKQGKYGLEIELHDPKDAVSKLLEVHGKIKPVDNSTLITIFQLPDNGR